MGAEGRYDLQLADNETAAATATAATTPQEERQSSVQNEQQQQEVWLKCTHEKFICISHYSLCVLCNQIFNFINSACSYSNIVEGLFYYFTNLTANFNFSSSITYKVIPH